MSVNDFNSKKRDEVSQCAPEDCSSCSADCGSRLDLNKRIVQIETDEGDKMNCLVMLKYMMEGKNYIAVMPLKDNPEGDIYLFRIVKDGQGLENIEDEDEYQRAARTFGIEMEKAQNAKPE